MRNPFTQLFIHMVWSTWDRQPFLTIDLHQQVYACIQKECDNLGTELIAIGGTADHVHILVRIPTNLSVAKLAKQVKGSSSHMLNHCLGTYGSFKWQGGYGAFTVSKSAEATVCAYINNQEQHHQDGTTDKNMEVAWENKASGISDKPSEQKNMRSPFGD